jgi:3-hydroxyacyl-CoA dehydrogenase
MPFNKIGIVGCGQMGAGIAEVSIRAGYNVLRPRFPGRWSVNG